jgi:hypothetical protein
MSAGVPTPCRFRLVEGHRDRSGFIRGALCVSTRQRNLARSSSVPCKDQVEVDQVATRADAAALGTATVLVPEWAVSRWTYQSARRSWGMDTDLPPLKGR